MEAVVVAPDVPFGEGPVWCPIDQTVVCTSVSGGALYRIWPDEGRAEVIADTGGGANAAALASDGGFLVTQNGGFDFAAAGLFADPPPYRPATPGVQRAWPDGSVTYLTTEPMQAPNDLVVRPDGTLLFTDPGSYPPPDPVVGRVMAMAPDGSTTVAAEGFWFCNGIALDPDGTVVVIERTGLLRLHEDGSRDWVIERLGKGAGDGFCVDADGRYYVASTIEHGIRVVDPDGSVVDFLPLEGDGLTTNCCFGGPDLRTLFVTDALPGRVVAWEHMPTPGLPLTPWPAP